LNKGGFINGIMEKTGLTPLSLAITAAVGFLVWEQISYLRKKKHLPGPFFKIPIIGSMMDSMKPTFDKYNTKWKSGDLSCVGVFNRYSWSKHEILKDIIPLFF
jgi:C-22 sterol desaturase